MSASAVRISAEHTNSCLFNHSIDENENSSLQKSFDESVESSSSIPSAEASVMADEPLSLISSQSNLKNDSLSLITPAALVAPSLPKTPVIIRKNQLMKQDDAFLRDLTACIQLKQQQKKINETTNTTTAEQELNNKSPRPSQNSNFTNNSPAKKVTNDEIPTNNGL